MTLLLAAGDYRPDWSVAADALPFILEGLRTTFLLTVITVAISMVAAVPVAIARMSDFELVRWVAQGYIEIFRCTPLLIQLFWIFYALPSLAGITIPGFTAAIIALSCNLTAQMAEAYRSGFQAVPVEQIEAARMLRISRVDQIRMIIVPQTLRQQLPVILSLNINSFKDTALVSTIGVADLMMAANTQAVQSYRSLEILTVAAAMYFVVAFPVSLVVSALERRRSGGEPPPRGRFKLPTLARAGAGT
ncbi:amino acid ABC transporter permease [Pseudonocardia acaciae]|uniref:amino acid ABC transporter permease n=1 Tax=Pseudonocardia acaciae TaxID=551276 RepID=UPI000685964F|nr:amino acid ABC transporter permease [Pseudonocardia acaciae]